LDSGQLGFGNRLPALTLGWASPRLHADMQSSVAAKGMCRAIPGVETFDPAGKIL
jgi:hypothetical protein